jgi:hypothetical protein
MAKRDRQEIDSHVVKAILDAIRGLQFGQVRVVVHDSRVIQVEKTERTRLDIESPFEKGEGI